MKRSILVILLCCSITMISVPVTAQVVQHKTIETSRHEVIFKSVLIGAGILVTGCVAFFGGFKLKKFLDRENSLPLS